MKKWPTKWLGRLAKLSFFLIAFFGVVVTVLFNMGGSSPTLKGAIEDYMTQATGYATNIQQFNEMTFFPNIRIDAENIILKKQNITALQAWVKAENAKPEEERGLVPPPISFDNPDGTIEKLLISIGFFDAGLARGRTISDLQIRNAKFRAGTIHAKPLFVKTLGIDETPEGNPFFALEGTLGDDAFNAEMDIEGRGRKSKRKYSMAEESPFTANIGDISISGILRARTMGGIHIRDLKIIHNDQTVIEATFSFLRTSDGVAEMRGNFELPEYGSNGEFDWEIMTEKGMQIIGTIDAPLINANDTKDGSKLSNAWKEWDQIFATSDDAQNEDIDDIKVTAKSYIGAGQTISPFNGTASIAKNQMTFGSASEKEAQ